MKSKPVRRFFRRLLARGWMLFVALIVIGLVGFSVYRLRGFFGNDVNTSTGSGSGAAIVPFNPKRVVFEVFGDPGATATISYTDVHAQPQHVASTALPWAYEDSTTAPAVIANVMAQSDGYTLGCRIIIDGEVKAERVVNAPNAYTYCLDKSG